MKSGRPLDGYLPGGPHPAERADRVFDRLLSDQAERPEVAWENLEDVVYHDIQYGDRRLDDSPELTAFMQRVWVFNKAMRWREVDGSLLAYETGAHLALTGAGQVSRWHTGSANTLRNEGDHTVWAQGSGRRRDGVVLPAFQFHRRQHPVLEFAMIEATCDWQVCIAVKGRSGRPLWSSGWRTGAASISVPICDLLRDAGYEHQFAEIHIAVMAWSAGGSTPVLTFGAGLPSVPALVTALPVIRTIQQVERAGCVRLPALVLDRNGEAVDSRSVTVSAEIGSRRVPMVAVDGCWIAELTGLAPGTHDVLVTVAGAVQDRRRVAVRVTDGRYARRDEQTGLLHRGGEPRPLSGSYCGSVFVTDPGGEGERLLAGQADWDSEIVCRGREERLHHWDALTEAELQQRFAFLSAAGWDVLHLHQHWSTWSRLDAGGHLSPRGAEQAALYYRVADRNDLLVMQTLFDYPYGVAEDRTAFNPDLSAPWSTYLDAGFDNGDWYRTDGPFRRLAEQYIREYLTVFGAETALLGLSHSGEADFMSGATAVNETGRLLTELGDRHLYYSEPVFRFVRTPEHHVEGFEQDLRGGRTYWIGEHIAPHVDLGVEFKLMRSAGIFMAEGNWAPANGYSRLHRELADRWGTDDSWTGTLAFRLRLRDSLYLALVHRLPLAMTWDEQVTEDEHRVYAEVARLVDWRLPVEPAPVEVVVADDNMTGVGRSVLASYVAWAGRQGVDLAVRTAGQPGSGARLKIRAGGPYAEPVLPEGCWRIGTPRGYEVTPSRSGAGETMIAYACNSGRVRRHYLMPGLWLHRAPLPARARFSVPLPPGATVRARAYDLNRRTAVVDRVVSGTAWVPDFGVSTHDYLLVLTPVERP